MSEETFEEESYWDEEYQDDECDLCQGDSDFAYQGFGPVCLKYDCKEWGGDGLCMLAIDGMAVQAGRMSQSELEGRICPLECPNCC
jgi:hypothetical protein